MTNFPKDPEVIFNNQFQDERGYFQEWFNKGKLLELYGLDFDPRQANLSVSKMNVIRGMHFGVGTNFQAKLVICASGSINDVAVCLAQSSPNFGRVHVSPLSQVSGTAVLIPPGFAHGFEVTSDSATVIYLQTHEYAPHLEFAINPLDPALGISWSTRDPILSKRDAEALSLAESVKKGLIEF